jgi:hypothetical protein
MPRTSASRGSQQGIYASFLTALARGEARAWLRQVVGDRVPEGVILPPNEAAIDHFLAIVTQHGDRATVDALGEAAGDLLATLLRDHQPPGTPDFLRTLARLLLILQFAPASPRVWRTLLFGYQSGDLTGVSPEGLDIRHLALLALSTSPSTNALPVPTMLAFFEQELREHPEYAPAAFAGLRQLAPSIAVQRLPDLIAALQSANPQIPPDQPLWELFVSLEDLEVDGGSDTVTPAQELGQTLRARPGLVQLITQIIESDLDAVEDFPAAWTAFQRGLDDVQTTHFDEFAFIPRSNDPGLAHRVKAGVGRLSGRPLLSARPAA